MQAGDVKNVLSSFSLELAMEDKAELDEEAVVIKLRKVCSMHQMLDVPNSLPPGWRSLI